ncbi:signal peptide peptidase SppA [Cohaesibacter sp. ES.047]|uniref:S49 family peptidase n=1 Tax=Cohaesibacter sp. ES.047 TaxID=1798205 RepID=UPI000BC06B81|nr:S49 family peptidase [Cohaesibacter sp. ES.047]SNY92457.1 signal peptide peptidase SppA [Cohaesibacter sp. ES.047]
MSVKKTLKKLLPEKLLPKKLLDEAPVIPVVRMTGQITGGSSQFRSGLNLASVAGQLQKAFSMKEAPAVAISVNSPGGSPVQSRLIYQRIRQLAEEKEKKVLVFCEDAAASGGYMIAIAGDRIIADPSSIVGSIGVVSGGFGFVDAIEKLGIERRIYTAGTQKGMLDPFKAEDPEHVAHLDTLLKDLFETFKDLVRSRRGEKLTEDEEKLFTGAFWTGKQAFDLGLVDELGDLGTYVKRHFGEEAKLKLISPPSGFFGRCRAAGVELGAGDPVSRIAAGFTPEAVLASLEERALWSRIGL